MATNNVHISDELFAKLQTKAAAEGKTVDEIAEDALRKHLALQSFERFRREGELRRGTMTDAEVELAVERAVHEARRQ
jgi:hypothetical protein